MADVKISQLPAATTPVDGTEVLPIVQSATTKQVSIANLTAGRAMAASSLTLTTPLAVTSGGTGLAAGTSGGIPYYSSTTAITSSAALAANALVIGGGAGVAPSTTTTASGILTFLGTPSSANLAAAVTDETGTGALVFGTSPTFTTSLTSPLVIGGTTASSSLTLQSTSGVGTSDSILFKVGNNGATTAATIDSAGNLGVGSTTPAGAKLFINGGSLFTGSPGSYGVGISGSLTSGRIGTYGTNTASAINTYFDDSTIELSAGVTSGYVTGISITGRSGSAYGDTIRFVTRGTGTNEAARFDGSGNLLVGTTNTSSTAGVGWKFLAAVNGSGWVCDTTGDGPSISFSNINATIANGYRWFSFRINSGATEKGSISYNTGTGQVVYNVTSDRRLKKNITPSLPALEKLKDIEVVSFDFNDQGHIDYGVIAQDLYKLFPDAVTEGDNDDVTRKPWSFSAASLVPACVKAIQELAAKVTALEAKQ